MLEKDDTAENDLLLYYTVFSISQQYITIIPNDISH